MIGAEVFSRAEDRGAISDVLYRYARAVDRQDEALLRSVYHPGATDDHGAFSGPAEEFVGWALDARRYFQATSHFLTNVLIEFDGDDAAFVESYFLAVHVLPNSTTHSPQLETLAGRYVDWFERRAGEWRIAQRKVVKDWRNRTPYSDPGDKLEMGQAAPLDPVYRREREGGGSR